MTDKPARAVPDGVASDLSGLHRMYTTHVGPISVAPSGILDFVISLNPLPKGEGTQFERALLDV
ncbi:hypothetical protein WP3W18E02_36560 [Klebsiella sp. WP3-W18-ESBL-02]|nr:hypothetical protein WP3W18E02_36560 [Klebsiella sp. WP3-W18-ESBL-02]BBR22179.1 hypothetical protein WP3S18E05_36590 [Klebsiella sp. WP3-S18-ESBL-05]